MARIHHCVTAACWHTWPMLASRLWWDKCPGPRDQHDWLYLHLQGRVVAGNWSAFPLLEASMIMHMLSIFLFWGQMICLQSCLRLSLKDAFLPCWRGMPCAIENHVFPHTLLIPWLYINIILTDWEPRNNAVGIEQYLSSVSSQVGSGSS